MRSILISIVRSRELSAFVFVWALQYIVFWVVANMGPNPFIDGLGSATLISNTVKPPPPTSVPSVGQNSLGGIVTIATHPSLLHYTLEIFSTNVLIMLLVSIPFFGLAYGEYIFLKIGAVVNSYSASNTELSLELFGVYDPKHLSLFLSGLLLTQPFFYLETLSYALACSAGLLGGVTLFRPRRRRVLWYLTAVGVSALMLLLAAFLEASFVLHYL
jgi:hypothetical protein